MSSWAKSKFFRAISEEKPRSECDEGISFGIWVTFERNVTFFSVSHQNSFGDPCGATHLAFACSLRSTAKVRLRSGWQVNCLFCNILLFFQGEGASFLQQFLFASAFWKGCGGTLFLVKKVPPRSFLKQTTKKALTLSVSAYFVSGV